MGISIRSRSNESLHKLQNKYVNYSNTARSVLSPKSLLAIQIRYEILFPTNDTVYTIWPHVNSSELCFSTFFLNTNITKDHFLETAYLNTVFNVCALPFRDVSPFINYPWWQKTKFSKHILYPISFLETTFPRMILFLLRL